MFFFGLASCVLWVPRFADVYGRHKLVCLGQVIDTCMFISLLFTHNYYVMLITLTIFGMAASIRQLVGFIYLME